LGTDEAVDAVAERCSDKSRDHYCEPAAAGTASVLWPTLDRHGGQRGCKVHDAGLGRAYACAAALAGEGFMVVVIYLEDTELRRLVSVVSHLK
jgi:hypothetical protein